MTYEPYILLDTSLDLGNITLGSFWYHSIFFYGIMSLYFYSQTSTDLQHFGKNHPLERYQLQLWDSASWRYLYPNKNSCSSSDHPFCSSHSTVHSDFYVQIQKYQLATGKPVITFVSKQKNLSEHYHKSIRLAVQRQKQSPGMWADI